MGWHVELHTDVGALPAVVAQLPSHLPLVIDHMGKPDAVHRDDPTVVTLVQQAAFDWLDEATAVRVLRDNPNALYWSA